MRLNFNPNNNNMLFLVLSIVLPVGITLAVSNLDSDLSLYGLAGLIGIALALIIFVNPGFGANILIVAVFSNISDELTNYGYPGIIKPLVLVVAITIASRYLYFEKSTIEHSKTKRIESFLILFFVIYTASFFMASYKDQALAAILDLGKDIIVIYCLLFTLRTPETWKRSIWVVILVTFGLSLLGLYQSVSGNYNQNFFGFAMVTVEDYAARLGGPINAPNMWGQTVVAVIALVIFRIIHERRTFIKIFAVLILGVLLLETLNTYSRGAYLALAIVVLLIFFVFEDKFSPMIAIAGVGLILLTIQFLPASYADRFNSLLILVPSNKYSVYQDSSFRGRSSELLTGLSMFKSSPLLGIGPLNYKPNYQKFSQIIGIEIRAEPRDPHSLYIQLLAENGLLGFLAFVGVIVSLFSGLAKAKRSVSHLPILQRTWSPWISSLQASLIGYLIAATILHGAYIRYFWILAGLGIAAIRITDEILNNNKESSQAIAKPQLE
ncbi:MAG: O-antigen ligase family protein [Anaerolineales bacterium]|nr:O-antigen ligase family protein [Anaerolineales bacterium]